MLRSESFWLYGYEVTYADVVVAALEVGTCQHLLVE